MYMRFTCATCGAEHNIEGISFGTDAPLHLISYQRMNGRSPVWATNVAAGLTLTDEKTPRAVSLGFY